MRYAIAVVGLVAMSSVAGLFNQASVTVTYHGLYRDVVQPGYSVDARDGVKDPTFRVAISGNTPTVTKVEVELLNGPGGKWVASNVLTAWVTNVTDSPDGAVLNNPGGGINFVPDAGDFYFFIAQGDANRVPPGAQYRVTLETSVGQLVGTVTLGATPDPFPTPVVTPPPPPVPTTVTGPRIIWPMGEYANGTKAISGIFYVMAADDTTQDLVALQILMNGAVIRTSLWNTAASGTMDTRGWTCTVTAPCTVTLQARTISVSLAGVASVVNSPVVSVKIAN